MGPARRDKVSWLMISIGIVTDKESPDGDASSQPWRCEGADDSNMSLWSLSISDRMVCCKKSSSRESRDDSTVHLLLVGCGWTYQRAAALPQPDLLGNPVWTQPECKSKQIHFYLTIKWFLIQSKRGNIPMDGIWYFGDTRKQYDLRIICVHLSKWKTIVKSQNLLNDGFFKSNEYASPYAHCYTPTFLVIDFVCIQKGLVDYYW